MTHRWLLCALALAALLVPGSAEASTTAVLGLALGAVAGIYALPLLLPSAVAAAPAVTAAVGSAATTVGTAIVANPEWAGGLLGGLIGLWLVP